MSWRRVVEIIGLVVLMGSALGQEVATLEIQGFVKNLEGGWSGRKVINTQYPGSVSLVRGDSSGNVVVAGQLYTSSQGGSGLVPFLLRYGANGALQWSQQIQVSDLGLDAKGNTYFISGLGLDQVSQNCRGFSGGYLLGKYSPLGDPLWKTNLCTDTDTGQAFLQVTPEGRVLVSVAGVLSTSCLGVAEIASLLSLSSEGKKEWCTAIQSASSPRVDRAGNTYLLDEQMVRAFSPAGQELWKSSVAENVSSLRSLEGFDSAGNLILSDLGERLVLLDRASGQWLQNLTAMYAECLGKRFAGGYSKLLSTSVSQGSDGLPYYYLSECDLAGQVLNIRRWFENDLRLVDVFDHDLPGILIGGSTRVADQEEQYPFVQKLGSDLKD